MLSLLVGASLLCSLPAPTAQSPPSLVVRHEAPRVELVAVSPRDPNLIFAVFDTQGALAPFGNIMARSEDGGASFEPIEVPASFVGTIGAEHLAFSRTGALFLANRTSVYRSNDRGASFTRVFDVSSGQLTALALDPFDGDRLIVGVIEFGGASADVVSSDGGATWAAMPLPAGASASALIAFDAAIPDRVLRYGFSGGFLITNGSGQVVHSFAPHAPSSPTVYGARLVDGRIIVSGGELLTSVDGGVSFSGVPGVANVRTPVAIHPNRPQQLVALSTSSVDPASFHESERLGSNDGGQTWFSLGAGRFDNDVYRGAFAVVPKIPAASDVRQATLLLGHRRGMTVGRADTDTPLGAALPPGPRLLRSAQIDQENSSVLTSVDPMAFSLDRGDTWRSVGVPSTLDGARLRVLDGGVVLLSGETTPSGAGTPSNWFRILADGTFSEGNGPPASAYREVDIRGTFTQLFVTTDGGQSWVLVDELPPPSFTTEQQTIRGQIRRVPGGVEIISRQTERNFFGFTYLQRLSRDLGATWEPLPNAGTIGSATLNEVEPDIMYATDSSPTSPTRRSFDGGATWSAVGGGVVAPSIVRGNLDPALVVRGVDSTGLTDLFGTTMIDGLEFSRDGGGTWVGLTLGGEAADLRPEMLAPDDSYLLVGPYLVDLVEEIGAPECVANTNSTGNPAAISALGSASVAAEDVLLWATDLPPFAFGLFSTSRDAGFVPNVAGSDGNLCLGGQIGRLWPQPLRSSAGGIATLRLNLLAMPQGAQLVPIQAGDTWRYEMWFRDGSTSNRTNAVAITFVP